MTKMVRVNATMQDDLVRRIDSFAASRYEDRSTAIRQLVALALREIHKRDALGAYEQGRVTLREFAAGLGLDYWEANELLRDEGVAIGQGSADETLASREALLADLRARVHDSSTGEAGEAGDDGESS